MAEFTPSLSDEGELTEDEDESQLHPTSPQPAAPTMKPTRQLAPLEPLPSTSTSEPAPKRKVILTPAKPPAEQPVSKPSIKVPSTKELFKRQFTVQPSLDPHSKKAKLTPAQIVDQQKKISISDFNVPNFQHVPPTNGIIVLPKPPSASIDVRALYQSCTKCGASRQYFSERFCGECSASMS